jgi:hypothetical protein
MHDLDDQLIKAILTAALRRAGKAEAEVVVPSAPEQRIDVYSEPDPALSGELSQMGLLGELAAAPALFESFSDAVRVRDLRACLRKQYTWHHEQERAARAAAGQVGDDDADPPARVPFPALVILSAGRPKTVLELFRFMPAGDGVYALAPGLAVSLVVLAELPRTPATVLVRLGSARTRRAAAEEILAMPAAAWEKRIAVPFMVKFGLGSLEGATPEELMRVAEMIKEVEDWERAVEHRGERRGEGKVLLKQLRLKFGELPTEVVARVEAAEPTELEAWAERVLTAMSLADVLGGK